MLRLDYKHEFQTNRANGTCLNLQEKNKTHSDDYELKRRHAYVLFVLL